MRTSATILWLSSRDSTPSVNGVGGSLHVPVGSNRCGETVGPASATPAGTTRDSRTPVVRARFAHTRRSHVLNALRPSNRSTPRRTAIHVSWATSSALASLAT